MYDASSVITIPKKLAAADHNWNMGNAPDPNNIGPCSSAHAVDSDFSYLNTLVNAEMDDEMTTYGNTSASTSDS